MSRQFRNGRPTHPSATFTPEKWKIIKPILQGEDPTCVSLAGAARKAGVTVETIRGWAKRSDTPHPDDHPLIAEVKLTLHEAQEMQAGVLEDTMWERAMHGWDEPVYYKGEQVGVKRKFDNRGLMKLLAVRDPRYANKPQAEPKPEFDSHEIYERLLAGKRMAETIEEKRLMEEAETVQAAAHPSIH